MLPAQPSTLKQIAHLIELASPDPSIIKAPPTNLALNLQKTFF